MRNLLPFVLSIFTCLTFSEATTKGAVPPSYTVTTIAGQAESPGSDNGIGTNALFTLPLGIAVDGSTNLYVADTANHAIRKITPAGLVSVFAGQVGVTGTNNGTGTLATFNNPSAMVADKTGNLYVVDNGTAIRKVSTNGTVTTLAGKSGVSGFANGTGTNATFGNLTGIALDNATNLYVADNCWLPEQGNYLVRKITPSGVVTTVAGQVGVSGANDAQGTNAQFANPTCIVVDGATNIYVGEFGAIRKIDTSGNVTTFVGQVGVVGGSNDGQGTNASFVFPASLALDGNTNLYVADRVASTIRMVTPSGVVTTIAGQAGEYGTSNGIGTNATFNGPSAITIDKGGNLYVADTFNCTIRKLALPSLLPQSISLGSITNTNAAKPVYGGSTLLPFTNGISGLPITYTSGNTNVATISGTLISFVGTGTVTISASVPGNGTFAAGSGSLTLVIGPATPTVTLTLTTNSIDYARNLILTNFLSATNTGDQTNYTVTSSRTNVATISGRNVLVNGVGPATLTASVPANTNYTAASNSKVLTVTKGSQTLASWPPSANLSYGELISLSSLSSAGLTVSYAGGGVVFSTNATNVTLQFTRIGMTTLTATNAGDSNWASLTLTATSSVQPPPDAWFFSTWAGSTNAGSGNGTGTNARFLLPRGVAADGNGNVYLADTFNNTIRKIAANGAVTTLAGSTNAGFTNGTGTNSRFYYPFALAVDGAGNVYVTDTFNHAIRKITPAGAVTTLAGSTNAGYVEGSGTNARFNYPGGITVDRGTNLYVADTFNHAIRKITPAGAVTTLAGGLKGSMDSTNRSSAKFNFPSGVAVDAAGNVYVADTFNNTIRRIATNGAVTTLAGSTNAGSTNATGTNARFSSPVSIVVDGSTNFYVADGNLTLPLLGNNAIRRIDTRSNVTTLAGGTYGSLDGMGTNARFGAPAGIAVDPSGNLYVADYFNNAIRKGIPGSPQNITFPALAPRTFGETPFPLSATATSLLPVTYSSSDSNIATISSNSVKILGVGTLTITASQAGGRFNGLTWFPAAPVTNTLVINRASQTVTAITGGGRPLPGTNVFSTNPIILGSTASGGGSLTYTSSDPSIATISSNRLTLLGAGTVTITANQAGGGNYLPASTSTTLVITPALQSISFPAPTPVPFSTLPITPGAEASSGLPITYTSSDERIAVGSGSQLTLMGIGTTTITARQSGGSGYTAALPATNRLVVIQGPPVITFGLTTNVAYSNNLSLPLSLSNTGDQTNFTVTSSRTNVASISGGNVLINSLGSTTLTASVAASANSKAATNIKVLTVTPGNQSITFAPIPPQTYGGDALTLSATSSIGQPVTYSLRGSVASLGGNQLRFTNVGTGTVTATAPATSLYAAATNSQAFTVSLGSQSITLGPIPPQIYGGVLYLPTNSSIGQPVTYSVSGSVASLSGNQLRFTNVGTGTITATTRATSFYGAVTNTQTVTVNAAPTGYSFYTLAGNGTAGFANGTGTNATFNLRALPNSTSVALDKFGNVYAADYFNHAIRKITPAGVVTTLAGGTYGSLDGIGTNARFGFPAGIAVDPSGNLYVADAGNNAIRKIDTNGVVTTVAGNRKAGFANGVGTNASFFAPVGVAVDGSGNVYVADAGNNAIRKIDTNGLVTTVAGNGTAGFANGVGANASFFAPSGVGVDGFGNLYVADSLNNAIRKGFFCFLQSITFPAIPDQKSSINFSVTLSATANSFLPVTYSSSASNIATISSNKVTILGAGTVTITATQSGGYDNRFFLWAPADPVTKSLVIKP